MGFVASLIGGGLGWTLGGPIGAIVGALMASGISNALHRVGESGKSTLFGKDYQSYNGSGRQTYPHRARTTQADFKMALLVLVAAVIKADGKILRGELDFFKKTWIQIASHDETLEALQILKRLLEDPQPIDTASVAAQCAVNMTYSHRLQLLQLLYELAVSDGAIEESELRAIASIAFYMRISPSDMESIKSIYVKTQETDWAYKVLQIDPSASDEDVKKAYRSMAMKYHPDKVATLGDDVKAKATERFREVKNAYDHIRKQRGF